MINPRVALLFKYVPEKYPRLLQRDFPHVWNRLMHLWGTPEFEPYMHDLMIDKRGGRRGFPLDVVAELIFLGELHDMFQRKGYKLPKIEDPWKTIPAANPTPLGFLHAIERGQRNVMETFLSAGVTIDYRFEGGQTPLMISAIAGRAGMAHCLIENGAGVNLCDHGKYTALHWAAFYGRTRVVGELLDVGAEINAVQNSGDTPLSLAVTRSHIAVVGLLLDRGADPNIASNHGSPLTIALKRSKREIIALLRQAGAFV